MKKSSITILGGILCIAAVLAACGGTAETGNYTALEITSSGSAETVEELEAESVTATGEPEIVTR